MTARLRALLVALLIGPLAGLVALVGTPAATAAGQPHVGISATPHHLTTSGSVRFTATTRNVPVGATVVLQQQAGGWVKRAAWPTTRGGKVTWNRFQVTDRHQGAGDLRFRMVLLSRGRVIAISRTVVIHDSAPKPPPPAHQAPPVSHACTRTSSGSCISGGEFCPESSYGMTGWDASGRAWVCTGDRSHPHWE
jgi:hypothetical protein